MSAASTPSHSTRTTSPDTPPATGTNSSFPANIADAQQNSSLAPQLSNTGDSIPPLLTPQHSSIIPLDTPPPSGGGRGRTDTVGVENLQQSGAPGVLPLFHSQSSVTSDGGTLVGTTEGVTASQPTTSKVQGTVAAAGAAWGTKKAIEEYEMAREKLVDNNFSLAWVGDDYDDSDMWQDDTEKMKKRLEIALAKEAARAAAKAAAAMDKDKPVTTVGTTSPTATTSTTAAAEEPTAGVKESASTEPSLVESNDEMQISNDTQMTADAQGGDEGQTQGKSQVQGHLIDNEAAQGQTQEQEQDHDQEQDGGVKLHD